MTKKFHFSPFVIVPLLLIPIVFLLSIETYWPFDPFIDTKFSRDFTTSAFDQVKEGDSIQEVLQVLGEPLWKEGCGGCWEREHYSVDGVITVPPNRSCDTPCDAENQYWQFSDDGACTWWDFAWQRFAIDFYQGKVVKKHAIWHWD